MLSSSFLMNVASGYMEGQVNRARQEREQDLERIKQEAETERAFARDVASAVNSKDFRVESLRPIYDAYGREFDATKYSDMANLAAKVAGTEAYLGYDLNLVQELDYDTMSGFDRAEIFWKSWNRQLTNPQEYQAALKHFRGNKAALDMLASEVRSNEFELRVGNQNRQTAASRTGTLDYIDLEDQYGAATRLFSELGLESSIEESDKAIAENIVDFDPETEVAVLMNTRQTGGALEPVAVGVDKATYALWTEMSANAGYKTVQHMLADFSIDSDFRNIDETPEQFAFRQNALLTNAAQVYSEYGSFLANPASMDKDKAEAFIARMNTLSGNNREDQIRMMSMMVPTPANVFQKVRQNKFAKNTGQSIKPVVTGSQFVERVTGVKVADFNDGLKAQQDAVDYLDRLMELEGEISNEVGTGWVRSSAQLLSQFGIQIQQGTTTLANVFGANEDFAATASGTSQADLQAVIMKVRPGINLENISEAEAIRLTLAAKMARAVDPSGRLSNQDFEIQLRRLGDGSFTTYGEIVTKLKTVRAEFAEDLQYKNRLKAVIDNQTALTPQVARTIEASMRMRNIEGLVYGAKGRDSVVGSDSSVTDQDNQPEPPQPESQNLPAYGTTGFYGPDKNGLFYKDPQGTEQVSPSEFRQKTQPKQGA